ncbi:MAG: hypothetical protein HFI42_15005 [Lachnospiraceae bacterium]|nr:hypothetical protein [Lachnospiraceae bacterium]MCI9151758.1 hypothetical protein [Lachnospiraceae bacterium]
MLQIGTIFQSGMVLQQGKRIRTWGMADAGAEVVVGIQNRRITVKADEAGQWKGEIPELEQSFQEKMTIRCVEDEIELADIAVGEVWLAGGQSNMEYTADFGCVVRRRPGSDFVHAGDQCKLYQE